MNWEGGAVDFTFFNSSLKIVSTRSYKNLRNQILYMVD
jgi:hypothetical protein